MWVPGLGLQGWRQGPAHWPTFKWFFQLNRIFKVKIRLATANTRADQCSPLSLPSQPQQRHLMNGSLAESRPTLLRRHSQGFKNWPQAELPNTSHNSTCEVISTMITFARWSPGTSNNRLSAPPPQIAGQHMISWSVSSYMFGYGGSGGKLQCQWATCSDQIYYLWYIWGSLGIEFRAWQMLVVYPATKPQPSMGHFQ